MFEVNGQRLLARLTEFAEIGKQKNGGVSRLAASDADRAARDRLVLLMKKEGLEIRIDRIGNIYGIRPGIKGSLTEPVLTGSHIDSVRNGGALDGTLGVVAGLEVLTRLNEAGVQTNRALGVASFTNEEGVRFQPDMMGSLVAAGGLSVETALEAKDQDGITLGSELSRIGYAGLVDVDEIRPAAFIELHIEQGPVLWEEKLQLGVVDHVQGILWLEVTLHGQANHAGTTPMSLRKDPALVACKTAVFINERAVCEGRHQVGTVGVIECKPNMINVIPRVVRMTIDLRNPQKSTLQNLEREVVQYVESIAGQSCVRAEWKRLVEFEPVTFDAAVVEEIERVLSERKVNFKRLVSGAGHDAQMMSRICPSAMIFAPSIDGISHNPEEDTKSEDLIAGANALGESLLRLANQAL